jgi:hypothetical protein
MRLTAQDMRRLEKDAGEAVSASLTYIADALRCLLDTRDPVAALELLHAMWGSGHAKRDNQRAGLEDAGHWLEQRIRRDIAISPERLTLELGWLQRLIRVYGAPDDDHDDGERRPSRRADAGRAPFGAHLEAFRARRAATLAAAAAARVTAHRAEAGGPAAPSPPPRCAHLPDAFEARFADRQLAIEAFQHARKRRKQDKRLKPRLLDVTPVEADLQPLATDLACSMLDTDGMLELLDRPGELLTFWINTADLNLRDDKRVPSRISFSEPANDNDHGDHAR